jgi:hypothetical protein
VSVQALLPEPTVVGSQDGVVRGLARPDEVQDSPGRVSPLGGKRAMTDQGRSAPDVAGSSRSLRS